MSVGRNHGMYIQEGSLGPVKSAWGQALFGGTLQLIAHPKPIGKGVDGRDSYNGTVGGLSMVAASVAPVVSQPGYFGDAPTSLQDYVTAPDPWNRP